MAVSLSTISPSTECLCNDISSDDYLLLFWYYLLGGVACETGRPGFSMSFLILCKLSGSGKSYEQILSKVFYPVRNLVALDKDCTQCLFLQWIDRRNISEKRPLVQTRSSIDRPTSIVISGPTRRRRRGPPSPNPFASAPRDSGSDEASREVAGLGGHCQSSAVQPHLP